MNMHDRMNRAQSNYDNMLHPDGGSDDVLVERLISEIESDHDSIVDVVYEEDNDEALKLAELRIVLKNASYALKMLTDGCCVKKVFENDNRMKSIYRLFEEAKNADEFVTERLNKTAWSELNRLRKENELIRN